MTTTAADIAAAAQRIRRHVHHPAVLRATSLGELAGVQLHVKPELFQRTGSFKARGATNAVLSLPEADRARGLVTMSAGNHAAALAYAARAAGTTATVVMPAHANPGKVAATRSYGGEVVLTEDGLRDTMNAIRDERGLTVVHPFDDPAVIAGAGTVGLEILAEVPEPDAVVVQVGGGGLLAGVATAVKEGWPRAKVYGVEPENADAMTRALAAGESVDLAPVSVADALCAPFAGALTLPLVQRYVDEVVRVPDAAILDALRLTIERTKLAVEPAGAAGVAALLSGAISLPGGARVVVIASGGNVDAATMARLLTA
jgi:threonine dehydratase